jgi:HTH-type transcriptional regulator / antitoxin MqsA
MQCGSCGFNAMTHQTFDETFEIGGQSFTVHRLQGFVCPKCNDAVLDAESYDRLTQTQAGLMAQHRRTESLDLRSRINLSQRELAELIGIGALAISRYERGVVKPSPAYLTLLRLLAKKPELLEVIRSS